MPITPADFARARRMELGIATWMEHTAAMLRKEEDQTLPDHGKNTAQGMRKLANVLRTLAMRLEGMATSGIDPMDRQQCREHDHYRYSS
jgi:hypothetical protein